MKPKYLTKRKKIPMAFTLDPEVKKNFDTMMEKSKQIIFHRFTKTDLIEIAIWNLWSNYTPNNMKEWIAAYIDRPSI